VYDFNVHRTDVNNILVLVFLDFPLSVVVFASVFRLFLSLK